MAAIETNSESTHLSEAKIDEHHVGELVPKDVEVKEDWLEEAREEPTCIENETDGEVEKRMGAPKLLPEGASVRGGNVVNLGVEERDRGDGAEWNKDQSCDDAETTSSEADLGLNVLRVCNGRLYGGQSSATPDALIGSLVSTAVGPLQGFAEGRALCATITRQPRPLQLQILSPPGHAMAEIANILEKLKEFGSILNA